MAGRRLKVFVTRRLPEPVERRLGELFDVTSSGSDRPIERAAIAEAMRTHDVLVPTLGDRIDAGLIGQASDTLKLIANYGAGFDHIDVVTALRHGVLVSNTPGVMAEDTADMAMALILGVPRRMKEGAEMMARGQWEGWSPMALMGHRLGGKRLGILGMGRIGQAVARRAAAFGLEINYHTRKRLHPDRERELGARHFESLDQMLARVNILTIHTPHTPATFHLINARRLKLMKPGAYLVNTARGEIVDENALTRALRNNELAGAGLDVFEHGADINPRLRDLPNVLLLPHMGSATVEGRIEMGQKVIVNIKTFADGHRPPDQVVPAML